MFRVSDFYRKNFVGAPLPMRNTNLIILKFLFDISSQINFMIFEIQWHQPNR